MCFSYSLHKVSKLQDCLGCWANSSQRENECTGGLTEDVDESPGSPPTEDVDEFQV